MKVDLLPHNQEAYEKVKNILQTNSKTCIIQPTGSGKSFLILKLIEDYVEDERDIIVIEPQKYIFGQLQKKMKKYGLSNEHVKFLTYSALGKIDEEKLQKYNTPVMVVVDEMHKAGAKTWKPGLQKMYNSFPNDCKYIGFSATPIRFLDGKRNMAEELFDGCIANEIGLADAILNRILPLPRYIAGLYTYDNEVNAITKKIRQSYNSEKEKRELLEEVSVMKKNLDKSKGISSIFKKYINSDKGKYVAFFRNVSHLQEMKPCLEKWFSEAGLDVNLYEVHCKIPEKDKQFNAFMEDDRVSVCLSVAMLSEGVHGIDGVILLRDLISPNLYYQQIGRAFSVDMRNVPIIFDLVANCESIMDCSLKNDLLDAIEKRDSEKKNDSDIEDDKREITKKDIEDFFVYDQVIDAVNAFRSIEGRLEGSWELYVKALTQYRDRIGDCLVPGDHIEMVDSVGVKLGQWVFGIRKAKDNRGTYSLTEEKEKRLNQLGFIWNAYKYRFENNIKAVADYYEKYKKYPSKASEDLEIKKLGFFVQNEKVKMRNDNFVYPEWKKEMIVKYLPDFSCDYYDACDNLIYHIKLYKQKYGNIDIKKSDVMDDGYNIGTSLSTFKKKYNENKMKQDRIKQFEDLGIRLNENKIQKIFDEKMEIISQAVDENVVIGHSNPNYKGMNLYRFVMKNIKKKYKKDKLLKYEQEIIEKLVGKSLDDLYCGKSEPVKVKVVDIIENKVVGIFKSQYDATKRMREKYDIKISRIPIIYRLTGKINTPYKGRFMFYHVDGNGEVTE